MERESFVAHSSYMQDIPDELYDKFAGMIMRFGLEGKEPEFTDWRDIKIWNSIKERICADFESYISTTEKRRRNLAQNHWKDGRASKEDIEILKKWDFDFSKGSFGISDTDKNNLGFPKNPKNPKEKSEIPSNPTSNSRREFDSEFGTDTEFEFDSEFDTDTEFESDCVSVSEETSHTPTLEEISEYVDSNDLGIDAERFFDTYEKSGWKINGKPFDWKKRADYWARTQTVKVKSASGGDVPDQWALTAENARKRRAKKNE